MHKPDWILGGAVRICDGDHVVALVLDAKLFSRVTRAAAAAGVTRHCLIVGLLEGGLRQAERSRDA